jgi:hypothetical protein
MSKVPCYQCGKPTDEALCDTPLCEQCAEEANRQIMEDISRLESPGESSCERPPRDLGQ